jgi:hypothetical protein
MPCAQADQEVVVNSGESGTSDFEKLLKERPRDTEVKRIRKPAPRSPKGLNKSREKLTPAPVKRFGLLWFKSLSCPDCGSDIRPFVESTVCPCCARPLTDSPAKPHDNRPRAGATEASANDEILMCGENQPLG